jgi:hypothetical protein
LSAKQRVIVYAGSSLVALVILLSGFRALEIYPIAGVLLMLAGMALSVVCAAGWSGAQLRRRE